MLHLHLVQHGQVIVASGELRPNEGPKRCVLDLMMVMELLIDVLPGPGQPLRPLSTHGRDAHSRTESLQITAKRLVDQVDDREPASRWTVAGWTLLPAVHVAPAF